MKKIFHTLFITTLVASTASINSMKRLNPDTDIATQENQIQEPLWLPDEVIIPIAAYSELKEKNVLMQLCKQFQQCLKEGKDYIITINPFTVHGKDLVKALFRAVRVDGAYPGGSRENSYYLAQRVLDTGLISVEDKINILFKTLLNYAMEKKNDAMCTLLIAHGASNWIPNPQIDPLLEAVYQGDKKTVKTLLLEGANPNLALRGDKTALYIAIYEGHTEIIKLLLAADGIDINKTDNSGCTPLYITSREGHTEIVKLLLAADGIDINKTDNYGRTPLYITSKNGHTEVVRLLIKKDVNINQADKYGYTPLYRASENGHIEVMNLLLAADRIDINQADKDGWTPLHTALFWGHIEAVKLLIDAGADINQVNLAKETPLQATQKRIQDINNMQQKINDFGTDIRLKTDKLKLQALEKALPRIVELLQEQLDRDAQQKQSMHEAMIPYLQQEEDDMSEDKKELMHNLEDFIDSL